MKIIIFFLGLTVFFGTYTKVLGQEYSCNAVYKTSSSIKVMMDNKNVPNNQQDDLNALIQKSMAKEYQLEMNNQESLYKEIPKLKAPSDANSIEVIGLGQGSEGGVYKNIIENQILETRDCFGKIFLVSDSLEKFDWQLKNETKMIGQYKCNKAVSIKTINVQKTFVDSIGRLTERESQETIETIAWYCPEIPLNHGPAQYWGLPGLILQIQGGKLEITCTSVNFNSDKYLKIKKPRKGKTVTRKEYDAIYNAKMKEWIEINSNNIERKDF